MSESDESNALALSMALRAACDSCDKDKVTSLLGRIETDIVWTQQLDESAHVLLQYIRSCSNSFPGDQQLLELQCRTSDKLAEDLILSRIQDVERRWWFEPPMPIENVSVLTFKDITAEHKYWAASPGAEVWEPQGVKASLLEPFKDAFQRFRVLVNKKYRHPFLPAISFDIPLPGSGESSGLTPGAPSLFQPAQQVKMISSAAVADYTVEQVLKKLSTSSVIPYVRNDDDPRDRGDSPAWLQDVWRRQLPPWCTTPSHWVEPSPPPGSRFPLPSSTQQPTQFYKKTETLLIPGTGRNIIPSATQPPIIASHVFIPVMVGPYLTYPFELDREKDHVHDTDKLIPGTISAEHARAFLGRIVQTSTEPVATFAATDGKVKRKPKRLKVSRFEAYRIGLAWGVDPAPGRMRLHCVSLARRQENYVVDLSVAKSMGTGFSIPEHPLAEQERSCAWLGIATLPADERTLTGVPISTAIDEMQDDRPGLPIQNDWYEKIKRLINGLNRTSASRVFEVGHEGTLLAGDIMLAKGEADDFEERITDVKPGVWKVTIGSELGEDEQSVRLDWAGHGPLSYEQLPTEVPAALDTAVLGGDWVRIGATTVDSGLVGVFSEDSLTDLLVGDLTRETLLECFVDLTNASRVVCPAGIVLRTGDGSCAIQGRRDDEGLVVGILINAN